MTPERRALSAGVQRERFDGITLHLVLSADAHSYGLMPHRDEEILLQTGMMTLLAANTDIVWRVQNDVDLLTLRIQVHQFAALESALGINSWVFDPTIEHFAGIIRAQHGARSSTELSGQSESEFWRQLTALLYSHLTRQTTPADAGSNQRTLSLLESFVDKRLAYDLSVEDMAKHLQLSKFQLLRMMKKENLATPQQFLIARRIEKAKQLLRHSDQGLAEIAYQTGFSSQSHLSNTFKQLVGLTPKGFRDGELATESNSGTG